MLNEYASEQGRFSTNSASTVSLEALGLEYNLAAMTFLYCPLAVARQSRPDRLDALR